MCLNLVGTGDLTLKKRKAAAAGVCNKMNINRNMLPLHRRYELMALIQT